MLIVKISEFMKREKKKEEDTIRRPTFVVPPEFSKDLKRLAVKLRELLPAELQETVDRSLDLYERNEFVILVAGEISVGKSSFLNALIGQSILLTDTTETTAAITYLRTAEGVEGVKPDHVKITYKSGKTEWISIHDAKRLKQVTTSLDGNMKAISRVRCAEVYCSKETLDIPPGITIIDTPGLNGSDSHADLTHREMGLCHAALYLLDATKFGTLSNREEFGKLYRYAPEVLFVVNKWDLVRSTGASLPEMKREYFEKLGNWAAKGDVTDENIFIVSGTEALIGKEHYLSQVRKNDRLPKRSRKSVSIVKAMPYPDNEFLQLEARLQELMSTGEKSRMIQRRPLQTLLQLTLDCEDEYRRRREKFLADDEELEERIALETRRVNLAKDDAEKVFSEVSDFAQRLEKKETDAYRLAISQADGSIRKEIKEKIGNVSIGSLKSEDGQKLLREYVTERIDAHYRKPICERFNAFVAFIQSQLETYTTISTNADMSIASVQNLVSDVRQLDREKEAIQRKLETTGTRREELSAQIAAAKEGIAEAKRELRAFAGQEQAYNKLDMEYQSLLTKRVELGSRPAKKQKWITKSVRVRVPGGCIRKFFAWFGICDEDTYEWQDRSVEIVDDSAGKAWDAKYAEIQRQIDAAKSRRDSAKPDYQRQREWEEKRIEHERSLQAAERQIAKLDEEMAEQRSAMRRYDAENVRRIVKDGWMRELDGVRNSFSGMVDGFRSAVDRLLSSYWESRTERIERYVADIRVREKEMSEQRKRTSAEFKRIQDALRSLSRIRTSLEGELKRLA